MKETSMFARWPTTLALPPFTEKQADVLREAQDELIDEVQQVADRWCARRHKTVAAMFDLSVPPLHQSGPVSVAEAWMRWYSGALQRLSEDAGDQMELAATLAKCCGNGMFMLSPTEGDKAGRGEGQEFRKAREPRRPAAA